ncbi:Clp protease ClpP [Hymenobacter sp. AT01-02]|uniref:Clp protease ClpP n=1 Tax=Hymenobacter sp. AT01-02 TaxID=1571877 RepID=UPI0005F26F48|nr:Clp protease ClpP [Hymenobacter sp. AT01-02]
MEATLFITGIISPNNEEGGSTSLEYVKAALEWQKPFDTVRVTINSPGGYVSEGMGIYDYLRSLPDCTIITEALGQCSSIGTAVFLAGSERRIHAHTEFLIHLPSGGAIGTADQMQQYVNDLKRDEQNLIDLYVTRAGVEETTVAELMAQETTLTPERAQELGFATLVVQPVTALARPSTALTVTIEPQPAAPAPSLMATLKEQAQALLSGIMSLGKTPATNLAVTTTGETPVTLTIDTGDRDTYEVGDSVTDSAGTAVADSTYALTDGNTITTVAGAITFIAPTATDTTDTMATDTVPPVTATAGDDVQQQILEAYRD